jgi:hypothetical protein
MIVPSRSTEEGDVIERHSRGDRTPLARLLVLVLAAAGVPAAAVTTATAAPDAASRATTAVFGAVARGTALTSLADAYRTARSDPDAGLDAKRKLIASAARSGLYYDAGFLDYLPLRSGTSGPASEVGLAELHVLLAQGIGTPSGAWRLALMDIWTNPASTAMNWQDLDPNPGAEPAAV